jgi:hypothetical protein
VNAGARPLFFPRQRWRALAPALLASLLLHLAMIAGAPDFGPGQDRENPHREPMVARLFVPPAAEPSPPRPEQPQARPKRTEKPARMPPKATPAPVPPAAAPAQSPGQEIAAPAATVAQEELEPIPGVPYARQEPDPVATAMVLPESAKLEYLVYYGEERFQAGRAIYLWEMSGDRYVLYNMVEATGLVSLFLPGQLVQESQGQVLADGLRPQRYVAQRGTASRSETVDFDWDAGTAMLAKGGTSSPVPILPGVQDPASVIQQLAFFAGSGAGVQAVVVADPRKVRQHDVQIVDQEMLDTPAGLIPTVHLRKEIREDAARVDVWLATERFLVPVKVRFRDRRGKLFEQVVSSLSVHGPP